MRLFVLATLAVLMAASSASASILGSFLAKGPFGSPITNTLNDTNREYIEKVGGDSTKFQVGDKVHLYLSMENISSNDFPQTFNGDNLDAANTGGAFYNLLGKGTFTISSIGTEVAGKADFQFTGGVTFYEKSDPGLNPFTTITDADAIIASATEIFRIGVSSSDDFIQALNAPVAFASIPGPGDLAVIATFGLSLTSGGGDLGIANNFLTGSTGKKHDFVGTVSTFALLSANNVIGDNLFDLETDTRLLLGAQVPEPTSMVVFFGIAACGLGIRRRKVS